MSQLDDLLGGLLGGKGGGALGDILSQLGGAQGGPSRGSGGGGSLVAALLPMLGGLLASGGLSKILAGFQQQGLSSQADSWIKVGPNEPVTAGDVEHVIGSDEIGQIAAKLGVSRDEAAQAIAEVLPQLVDGMSPEGQLPPEQDLDATFDRLAHLTVPA